MKILIVGLGKVGRNIAEELTQEEHDLTLIDNDEKIVSDLSNSLDVLGVVGDAVSLETLKEAGVEKADILIAGTSSDEVNMLCCLFARKANPKIKTIARVRNPIYSKEINYIKEELGLTLIINPEMAAAREISRILRLPLAMKVEHFSRGRVELVTFEVPKGNVLVDKSVKEIAITTKEQILFAGIERGEEAIVPNGNTVIKKGDKVSIIAKPVETMKFFEAIGLINNPIKSVMIAGGSTLAYYLTTIMLKNGIDVSIVEKDKERCEELVDLLPNAHIIYGDASDNELLIEEGLKQAGGFISLTDVDEENVMLSLFATSITDAKVITKVNHIAADSFVSKLKAGSLVSPKHITADNIITYIRGLAASNSSNVTSLYRIVNNKAEAISFKIKAESKLTNIPLMDLNIVDNLLICAIIRDDTVIMPSGKDIIKTGDVVLVVTTNKGIESIEEIIK